MGPRGILWRHNGWHSSVDAVAWVVLGVCLQDGLKLPPRIMEVDLFGAAGVPG